MPRVPRSWEPPEAKSQKPKTTTLSGLVVFVFKGLRVFLNFGFSDFGGFGLFVRGFRVFFWLWGFRDWGLGL